MATSDLKPNEFVAAVSVAVDELSDELIRISKDVHAHPELNYEEFYSSALLADAMERHGFTVERGTGGVETAFRATLEGGAGSGPTVAFLAEYDALPEIGHGCGHNLIAISNIGAALALKALMPRLPGTIQVLGTPAEEGGGGKIRMIDAGSFGDVDVALSSHPAANRTVIPNSIPIEESWSLAMVGYRFAYHGKAAHAAVSPHHGINALNSVIHLFTGIDALRQHLREDVRIHGIITDGGLAPNIVPDFAAANFMLRSRDRDYLGEVVEKVKQVAEGAATLTGATLEILDAHPLYENVRPNEPLARAARQYAEAVGMNVHDPRPGSRGGASTDFGNVSQRMPSFAVNFAVSETPIPAHSIQMTEAALSDLAHESALGVAKSLALTGIDALTDADFLQAVRADFEARDLN